MTTVEKMVKIGLGALNVTPSGEFSIKDYNKAFDGEIANNFNCRTTADFMRIKPDVFELLQEIADEYFPARLNAVLGQFAEIRQVPQGSKVEFKLRKGHQRGKQFVTQVAPSGQYETFRLDSSTFQVPVKAYGAGALVDWERFLNGDESFIELMQIIAEGIEDRIYEQIQGLMQSMMTDSRMPAANKYSGSTFDPAEMDRIIAVVRAYGKPAIYATQEFASTITNQVGFTGATPTISEMDLVDIREKGYVGTYKGCPVIVLPQSFKDTDNKEKIMNPQFAYIIPMGEEKIVKIVLEGLTQICEFDNRDWSSEIQMYKKVGIGIVGDVNFAGIYQNTSLS